MSAASQAVSPDLRLCSHESHPLGGRGSEKVGLDPQVGHRPSGYYPVRDFWPIPVKWEGPVPHFQVDPSPLTGTCPRVSRAPDLAVPMAGGELCTHSQKDTWLSVDISITGMFLRVAPSQGSAEVQNLSLEEISLGNYRAHVNSHWPHHRQPTTFLAP